MKRPNIVFVFADQLRYDSLACNGNRVVQTPAIDAFAQEGLSFDHAFSSAPICAPYRGQLLTGNYAHTNGVVCNEYQLFENQVTLPQVLKGAGYRTAFIGKWHLGYPPYTPAKRFGFDDLVAYNCNHAYYDVEYWHNERGPFRMGGYAPRCETQLTLDYIKDHVTSSPEQPFCVVLGWGPPHWNPPPDSYKQYPNEYDLYDPQSIPLSTNVPRQFEHFARQEIADYYGMVTSLDDCFQRILTFLDEQGLRDDTIVCFTSDHGDHLSAHGFGKPSDLWMEPRLRASKATPYEESIRVPFIMRYPGVVPAHRRTDLMFSSVDIFPTLLGMVGLPVPETVQGSDLSQSIESGSSDGPDSVYLQNLGTGWPNRLRWVGFWRGLRTDRFTYARWHFPEKRRLLFDLKDDPEQTRNLADEKDYAGIVEQMEARLQAWIEQTGDPFEYGPRLPGTGMLDIGQRFTNDKWLRIAPRDDVEAMSAYRGVTNAKSVGS